ncbi:MAG TPA: hypothetical protein HPP56_09405 [Nitrospirae bacterium]|nr:hypothetical protein [Nitrospirota bacterium]
MARFEELQIAIIEAATNYLELHNLQVLTEQFTLDRESNISLFLPNQETQHLLSAEVSYVFDAFQTGFSFVEDMTEDKDVDTTIEIDFTIKFPVLRDYPNIMDLYNELADILEDIEATLIIKEHIDMDGSYKLYEFTYSYEIDFIEDMDSELLDVIFDELKKLMTVVYEKTKRYIDYSWYNSDE